MKVWSWLKTFFAKRTKKQKELTKNEKILILEENGYKVFTNKAIDGVRCGPDHVSAYKDIKVNNLIIGGLGIITSLEMEGSSIRTLNYSTLKYSVDNSEYFMYFNIVFNEEKDVQMIETVIEFIGCILEKHKPDEEAKRPRNNLVQKNLCQGLTYKNTYLFWLNHRL